MRSRHLVAGAVIAAAALTLTACSTSDPAAPTASNLDGEAFKIGLAVAQTGFGASQTAPSADVAQAWSDWVNANGGIDGHPVEVIVKDSAGNPATALAAVKELVEQDDVNAIMVLDPTAESATKDYVAAADIAVLDSHAYDPSMFSVLPNFFTTSTSVEWAELGYTLGANAAGGESIGLAVCAEVAACANVVDPNEDLADSLGMTYTMTAKVSASAPNFTAECLQFIQSDTAWIGLALDGATTARFISDCTQQGYEGGYAAINGSAQQSILDEFPGVKFAGLIPTFPFWASDEEPVAQYLSVMEQYQPDTESTVQANTGVWTGLEMWRKAVSGKAESGLTRQDTLDAFGSIKDETLQGLVPQPVTYTTGQPAPEISCYWLYSYTGGEGDWETLSSGTAGNDASGPLQSTCSD